MPLEIKRTRKISIKKEDLADLCSLFQQMYSSAKKNTGPYKTKLEKFRKQTKALLHKERPKQSWQTNLSLPLTKAVIDAIAARLFTVLYETNQITDLRPTGPEDVDTTKKIELWFNDRLMNNSRNLERNIDKSIKKFLQDGIIVFHTHYEKETKPELEIETHVLAPENTMDNQAFEIKCHEIIGLRYRESLFSVKKTKDFQFKVTYKVKPDIESLKIKNEIKTATLDFWPDENETSVDVEIKQDVVTYSGTTIEGVSLKNIMFEPDTIDFQTAKYIIYRTSMSFEEIKNKQKNGSFDLLSKDNLEELEKIKEDNEDEVVLKEIAIDKELNVTDKVPSLSYPLRLHKYFYKYDIDNDGQEEDLIFNYLPSINKIASIRYLTHVYPHGERPFTFANPDYEDEEIAYGIGLPEELSQIAEETDIMNGLFIDNSTLAAIPTGRVRAGSATHKEMLEKKNIGIHPGVYLPVEKNDDLGYVEVPNKSGFALQEMNVLWGMAQKLTGLSDAAFGEQQFSRTPVGTTLKLLAEQNLKIRMLLRRFLIGFKGAIVQAYKLERTFAPKQQIFRFQGRNGEWAMDKITREELRNLPDFSFHTSIDNINKVFTRDAMLLLFQQVATPLPVQMGIIQPYNLYEILVKIFNVHDIPDYHKYLTAPVNNPPRHPDDENEMMKDGKEIDINPLDDDNFHYEKHMEYISGPMFGYVLPERVEGFKRHLIKTTEQRERKRMAELAAIQQQQNQQQGGGGANPNIPLGVQRPKIQNMMSAGGGIPAAGGGGANPTKIQNMMSAGGGIPAAGGMPK